jgi:hypothetical protein
MFEYLLMPFNLHADYGFGVTADAYKAAADTLEKDSQNLNAHLPIRFLRRHAIELFLKSAIIIFHRTFQMPFGQKPSEGDPMVIISDEWKRMGQVHSIKALYEHVKILLTVTKDWMENTRTDWSLPDDLEKKINIIEGEDPGSTYFRYPITKDRAKDARKSSSRKASVDDMLKRAKAGQGPMKAMLLFDGDDNLIESYDINSDQGKAVGEALSSVADTLSGLHAALRAELTKGL